MKILYVYVLAIAEIIFNVNKISKEDKKMKKCIYILIVLSALFYLCSCSFSGSINLSEDFVDAFSEKSIEIVKTNAVIEGNVERKDITRLENIIKKSFGESIIELKSDDKENDNIYEYYIRGKLKDNGIINLRVIDENYKGAIVRVSIDRDSISKKNLEDFFKFSKDIEKFIDVKENNINFVATFKGMVDNHEAEKEFLLITNQNNNLFLKNKLNVKTRYSKYDDKTYATFILNN
jgi:hypothetical protein